MWGLLLFAAACYPASSRVINLDNSSTGKRITASIGDEIDIDLQSIGPGQYGDPSFSAGALVFLEKTLAGPQNPAGPHLLYRFRALNAGQAEIIIPFTDGLPNASIKPPFTINIIVR